MIVIVDIDGTVSKVGDRIKYLEQKPKDWDSFYEACDQDEINTTIQELVGLLAKRNGIVFITGRREGVRAKTNYWLRKYFSFPYVLLMRPDGDYRHDTMVKPELFTNHGYTVEEVELALEDRNSMVAKWREMGITCLQVADGNF